MLDDSAESRTTHPLHGGERASRVARRQVHAGAVILIGTMDVRVGGTRRVCMEMQTPTGPTLMWFSGEYRDVVEHKRLVYTESMSDDSATRRPEMASAAVHPLTTEVRVELEDVGGRTKMVMTHIGVPRLPWCDGLGDGLRQARGASRAVGWRLTSSPRQEHRAAPVTALNLDGCPATTSRFT